MAPRVAACCGARVALFALLMLAFVDGGAAAPDDCCPEMAGSLGEAVVAILLFFSAVKFSATACAAMTEEELSLPTVQACWEAAESASDFVALVRECCPKLPGAVSVEMAAVFRRAERAGVGCAVAESYLLSYLLSSPSLHSLHSHSLTDRQTDNSHTHTAHHSTHDSQH